MKKNIPIYRAKKIDSDEYIEGFYFEDRDFLGADLILTLHGQHQVDKTTLAINFEKMIDCEGNKIFASLAEDGKGGDIFDWENETYTVLFDKFLNRINAVDKDNLDSDCHHELSEWKYIVNCEYPIKIMGIQE